MGTKQDLAILYSSLSLPIEEFRKLPAFIRLEQETDLIERLKDYDERCAGICRNLEKVASGRK